MTYLAEIPPNTTYQRAGHFLQLRVLPTILMLFVIVIFTITFYIRFTAIQAYGTVPNATKKTAANSSPLLFGIITAYFYKNPNGSSIGRFDISQLTNGPVFKESFFYPNSGILCSSKKVNSSVLPVSAPFTYIDDCVPIPAREGSNTQSSLNNSNLQYFEAVFLTSITVPGRGTLAMNIIADDGWIVSIGSEEGSKEGPKELNCNKLQPTLDQNNIPTANPNNIMKHPLISKVGKVGACRKYPEMGDNNGLANYKLNPIKINFPAAGTYPVEIDYTECCLGEMALVVTNNFTPLLS